MNARNVTDRVICATGLIYDEADALAKALNSGEGVEDAKAKLFKAHAMAFNELCRRHDECKLDREARIKARGGKGYV